MNNISLDEYEKFVNGQVSTTGNSLDEFIKRLNELNGDINISLMILAGLGLSGEAGEVTDLVKKILFHGKPFSTEIREKIIEEAGDTMFYMQLLCIAMNIDIETLIENNVSKLKKRYPEGHFSVERSENRSA